MGQLSVDKKDKLDESDKFKNLEALLAQVLKNYDEKKKQYEDLQKKTMAELGAMHQEGDLQKIRKEFREALELKLPEGSDEVNLLHEFQSIKKTEFKKFEELIHIFDDWLDDKLYDLEHSEDKKAPKASNLPPNDDDDKKVMRHQSSQILQNANAEVQAVLQAKAKAEEDRMRIIESSQAKEKAEIDRLAQ